jgi:paraquat-inducible protein A
LHQRKTNSLTRTWALVIAAFIFYIPANVLPITVVTSLGKTQADTIMSGVIYFMLTGMWPIALVIFVASVAVPLIKLFVLSYLLISVQRKSRWRPEDRTRLYRIAEAVGRWSMVDIFVVTILVLSHCRGCWSLVHGGYFRGYYFGGSGETWRPGDNRRRAGCQLFCGGGSDHHLCRHEL